MLYLTTGGPSAQGLGDWTSLIFYAFAIVALLTGVAAFFRGSYGKATIETLQANCKALQDQVLILEGQRKTDGELIHHLKGQVDTLLKQLQQVKSIDDLASAEAARHVAITAQLTETNRLLGQIASMGDPPIRRRRASA